MQSWQGSKKFLVLSLKQPILFWAIPHDLGDDDGVTFCGSRYFLLQVSEHAIATVGFY